MKRQGPNKFNDRIRSGHYLFTRVRDAREATWANANRAESAIRFFKKK